MRREEGHRLGNSVIARYADAAPGEEVSGAWQSSKRGELASSRDTKQSF